MQPTEHPSHSDPLQTTHFRPTATHQLARLSSMVHHKTRSQYARGSMVTWDQRGWYWDMGMGIYVGTAQAKKKLWHKRKNVIHIRTKILKNY